MLSLWIAKPARKRFSLSICYIRHSRQVQNFQLLQLLVFFVFFVCFFFSEQSTLKKVNMLQFGHQCFSFDCQFLIYRAIISHLSRDYFSFIARLFLIYRAIIFNFSNFRHRGLTLELEEAILLSDAEPLTRDPLVDLSFSIKCFLFSMSLFSPFFSFLSQNRRSPFVCNPSYIRKNSGQYITAEPSILNKNTQPSILTMTRTIKYSTHFVKIMMKRKE